MEKVIAISDIHLGEEECTLKEGVLDSFRDELKGIGQIDQLVLLGDVLDLSMASFAKACAMAKEFFAKIGELEGIKEIIFIPGNHDHHLWVQHIEHYGMITQIQEGRLPEEPDYIKEFKGKGSFLAGLLPDEAKEKLTVKYPNHLAQVKGKNYFFHHGHHLSKEGTLLMTLKEALEEEISLNEFELHNSSIHELIQYSLEQSDSMREKMEYAWTKGGALSAILSVVDEMTDGKGWTGRMARLAYQLSLMWKSNAMRGSKIDDRIIGDMERYLKLSKASNYDWFVFGHTHIPEGRRREGSFSMVNTGSWFESQERIHNTYVVIDDKVVIRRLGDTTPCWE